MLIDSHCHLNYKGMAEDQAQILSRARDCGISAMLNISTRQSEWDDVIATAVREPDIWASIGIHPHEADDHHGMTSESLVAAAAHERVIGIGETGLDYFYDHSDREQQKSCFREHIQAARITGLPMIVHMRDAEDDCLAIFEEERERGLFPVLIHCFTASAAFAQRMVEWNIPMSISGIVTFKNAKDLQAVAAEIPDHLLLVETDSPFLAPVPHRGKRGEPAFVRDTAQFLAHLRGVELERLGAITTQNFYRLFSKAVP